MNLGLGNLIEVKRHLLAPALQANTSFDNVIADMARGVAGQFEKFCNRKFGYVANDSFITSADRNHVYVPRFPIVSVASLHLKVDETEGFVEQPGAVQASNYNEGYLWLGAEMGDYFAQLKVIYTGGFWFDTSEDFSGAQPAGSTARPDDLKLAWLIQLRQVWNVFDKIGVSVANKQSGGQLAATNIGYLELIPEVKEMLNAYIRYSLT